MAIATHRKYTNKDFKDNFVDLASNDVKKGHLVSQSRKSDDVQVVEGILKQIIKSRIDTNGWLVEVGDGTNTHIYKCTNPNYLQIPESTETDSYYVPKGTVKVQFIIDKYTKIYTITRIITNTLVPISSYDGTLYISLNNNTKENNDVDAVITMNKEDITLNGNVSIINGDTKVNIIQEQENQQNQIDALQKENSLLKSKIDEIEKQINTGDES